jgi:hypothetical protein
LWTEEDRGWAMALHAEEASACPGCGHPLEESSDPRAEEERRYEVTRVRCHACTPKEKQKQRDSGEDPGLIIGVRRR